MEASTLEQATTAETLPVFVADGRRRHRAVRVLVAIVGLLLAVWLAALAAGLVGFSPLPRLAFPGTDQGTAPSVPSASAGAVGGRVSGLDARAAPALAPGESDVTGTTSQSLGSPKPTASQAASPASPAASPSSRAPANGSAATQSAPGSSTAAQAQTTSPPAAGSGTQTSSGRAPSYTPPASGDQSATPPKGSSANAPGSTTSADARSKATGYWPTS